jgi:ribose/xylose/arabinose/galactoside ABC-type transport system permease subunit
MIGAATIACLLNLIVVSGADAWLQLVVKGTVIVAAVAVQQVARGRR